MPPGGVSTKTNTGGGLPGPHCGTLPLLPGGNEGISGHPDEQVLESKTGKPLLVTYPPCATLCQRPT